MWREYRYSIYGGKTTNLTVCIADNTKNVCSVAPQSSVVTFGFCITYNQTLSLVRNQEGTWRFLLFECALIRVS